MLVLAAGVLLVAALAVFLAVGKWKNPLNLKEMPKRLGINIQQDATGYTFEHAFGAHSRYRIHASKLVQYKQGTALLDDVKIELYAEDGNRVDRIEGSEFEYDQKSKTAKANGPVEITLMRPGVAPAIAPKAAAGNAADRKVKGTPLAAAAEAAARGEIHVKTSGLSFDETSGVATTARHVDFSMVQGSGSSMGATYDSQQGRLVLDREVELTTRRGGETVRIHAQHAEFERETQVCRLHAATADYRGGEATAGDAKVLFREDGSAVRLDAVNGFTLTTATGGHVAAPTGSMDFNERNQPRHGHLEGGVRMDSATQNGSQARQAHGSSAAAELEFTPQGELRQLRMEREVEIESEETSPLAAGAGSGSGARAGLLRVKRNWRSPVANVAFRDAGHGHLEPATIHGTQGVVVTGESQRGQEAAVPSRLSADELTGEFGPGSALTAMTGTGHASMEQTSATGVRQTSTGDRIEAHFAPGAGSGAAAGAKSRTGNGAGQEFGGGAQIQSAVLDGHVVLVQQSAPRPGEQAEPPMRATAARAVYEGAGAWLRLTLSPRVEDGGLQLTADKIDVSEDSGDAFAHGNVKATWTDVGAGQPAKPQGGAPAQSGVALGGQGPAHMIAAEAQLHRATGEATFRGHARLWQQANSVAGPVIVLDRARQTLTARSAEAAEPVRAVLVSAGGAEPARAAGQGAGGGSGEDAAGRPAGRGSTGASVIRVRGGDLKYSGAERKAVMRGGALNTVVAETGTATSVSDEVELTLLPPGNHAGKDGAPAQGDAQVDRMTARGHVSLTFDVRHGSGEQLVYTGETGEYVLTGTAAAPPRMADPARGTVTGEALIYHSRDGSVTVEGGGRKTTTQTTAPK
jgi:lipopolysaccharide export system protein LptA